MFYCCEKIIFKKNLLEKVDYKLKRAINSRLSS